MRLIDADALRKPFVQHARNDPYEDIPPREIIADIDE